VRYVVIQNAGAPGCDRPRAECQAPAAVPPRDHQGCAVPLAARPCRHPDRPVTGTGVGVLVGAVAGLATTPIPVLAATRLRPGTGSAPPVPQAARTVIVTVLTVVAGAAVAAIGIGWWTPVLGGSALIAVTAATVDLTELRLPDLLVYPLLAAGVAVAVTTATTSPSMLLWVPVVGAVGYGGWMLLLAVTVPGSYGLGDVKLAAAVGLWTGILSWTTLATAVLIGQLLILASLVAARLPGRRSGPRASADAPLGPALVGGALLAILVGG
jgi:leader peptidase (prepilin peptidase)/N-methyltransferase